MELENSPLFSVDRSSVCLNTSTIHKGLLPDLPARYQMTWQSSGCTDVSILFRKVEAQQH